MFSRRHLFSGVFLLGVVALGGMALGFGLAEALSFEKSLWPILNRPFIVTAFFCLFLSLLAGVIFTSWLTLHETRNGIFAPLDTALGDELAALTGSVQQALSAMRDIRQSPSVPGLSMEGALCVLRGAAERSSQSGSIISAWLRPLNQDLAASMALVASIPLRLEAAQRNAGEVDLDLLERLTQSVLGRLSELVRCLAQGKAVDEGLAGLKKRCTQIAEILPL